jgi:adenylate cyclase
MAKEIERKFLVKSRDFLNQVSGVPITQGYISSASSHSVRVRRYGDRGFITIKGPTKGATRDEFEYEIPRADAEEMLANLCEHTPIEKTRYRIPVGKHTFEVDRFGGTNEGLIVAEVELASEDEAIELPDWIGREVTDDPRYYNSNLSRRPFTTW